MRAACLTAIIIFIIAVGVEAQELQSQENPCTDSEICEIKSTCIEQNGIVGNVCGGIRVCCTIPRKKRDTNINE